MSVHNLDDKRKLREKLEMILGSEDIILAYLRKDGSVGTLCTTGLADATLMLAIIRTLYVDSTLHETLVEPVED